MLLGKARGRVGNLVFYDNKGQQVVRAYQPRISNPQTQAQQVNRVIMNTVTQAWKFLKPFCYYEGHAKSEYRSLFFKWNTNRLRNHIIEYDYDPTLGYFSPLGSNEVVPFEYDLIRSTLTTPGTFEFDDSFGFYNYLYGQITDGSYEDIINLFGLERGDALLYCFWGRKHSNLDNLGDSTPMLVKIVLDPYEDGEPAPLSSQFLGGEDGQDINLPNPNNVNSNNITFEIANNSDGQVEIYSTPFKEEDYSTSIRLAFFAVQKKDGTITAPEPAYPSEGVEYDTNAECVYNLANAPKYRAKLDNVLGSNIYLNNATS